MISVRFVIDFLIHCQNLLLGGHIDRRGWGWGKTIQRWTVLHISCGISTFDKAPISGRDVETWFELQPDCFCDQAVCHYNSAISPTENLSTLLNTTQIMLPTRQCFSTSFSTSQLDRLPVEVIHWPQIEKLSLFIDPSAEDVMYSIFCLLNSHPC